VVKPTLSTIVLALAALCAAATLVASGCGSQLGCGNTTTGGEGQFAGCGGSPIAPQGEINFVGDLGTPFRATVSDTKASYTFQGVVPLSVIYVNNVPPIRAIATNLSTNGGLLGIQALSAFTTTELASTNTTGATVQVNVGGALTFIPGPAFCDVRFLASSPRGQYFQSLLEQSNNAYENQTPAPVLFLLGQASGTVNGMFTEVFNDLGPLKVELIVNGILADADSGLVFSLKSGCS
jgi:hypothetical protein